MTDIWTYALIILIGLAGGLAFFAIAALLVFLGERAFLGVRRAVQNRGAKPASDTWVEDEEHEREVEDAAAIREEAQTHPDTLSTLMPAVTPVPVEPEAAPEPISVTVVPTAAEAAPVTAQAPAGEPAQPRRSIAAPGISFPRKRRAAPVDAPAAATEPVAAPAEVPVATSEPIVVEVPEESVTRDAAGDTIQPEVESVQDQQPVPARRRGKREKAKPVTAPVPTVEDEPAAFDRSIDPLAELRAQLNIQGRD